VPVDVSSINNIKVIDTRQRGKFYTVLSYMKKSNLIVLHYLSFTTCQQLFLLFNPFIINKITWVAWDLIYTNGKESIREAYFIKEEI
jgi:hypothetical protein